MLVTRELVQRCTRTAIGALQRAKASKKSYNTPEVNAALAEMFCGKCYICESKEGISSFQIEHLKPHGGDGELKYDWNNLSRFKNLVRAYYEAEEFDKEDIRCAIRREVGKGAAFTAFKRWLLWDHRDTYGEVLEFCDLPQKQLLN